MTSLLELHNLRVILDQRPVLEIERLTLKKNNVTALTGPNGAGKSTLILVLAGLLDPSQGEIFYCGKPIKPYHNQKYRRRIGLVMQEPQLLDMSVYDNVAIGLRIRKVPRGVIKKHVDEWLDRLKIAHLKDRPARKLSGGESQRVALARSMIYKPELLLLDEPFSSLDKVVRNDLIRDFRGLLPETGATILFSTHDEREVDQLADNRIELLEGRPNSRI